MENRLSAPLRYQRLRIALTVLLALLAVTVMIFFPHMLLILQIVFLVCLYRLLPLRWPATVERIDGSLLVTRRGRTTEIPLDTITQFAERPVYFGLRERRRGRLIWWVRYKGNNDLRKESFTFVADNDGRMPLFVSYLRENYPHILTDYEPGVDDEWWRFLV